MKLSNGVTLRANNAEIKGNEIKYDTMSKEEYKNKFKVDESVPEKEEEDEEEEASFFKKDDIIAKNKEKEKEKEREKEKEKELEKQRLREELLADDSNISNLQGLKQNTSARYMKNSM